MSILWSNIPLDRENLTFEQKIEQEPFELTSEASRSSSPMWVGVNPFERHLNGVAPSLFQTCRGQQE